MAERRRTRTSSKITMLPVIMREMVDDMLLDTSNTYEDVAAYLQEHGYDISKSAVGRYAIRANQATQRVVETLAKTKAIIQAVEKDPDLDYTKASRILMMDGLMQRVTTAEEEFQNLPLDKAGRLIASLSRVQVYEDKIKRDYKKKMELAFEALEAELTKAIKADPELTRELKAVLVKGKEKLMTDD